MVFRGVPGEMAETLTRVNQPFSVWSSSNGHLLTARDHLGVAPLFYARGGQLGWTVGTTVGEILDQLPETRTPLDEGSVVAHVAGPVPPVPTRTFYSRINAVPPATLIRFSSETADIRRYWRAAEIPPRTGLDLETAAGELRSLLIEVITDHLPDGPVAVALDSGLDSAAVLVALKEAGAEVEAIAWKPTEAGTKGRRWETRLTQKLGVELTELPMGPDDLLPESGVVTRRSTPYFDRFDHMWRVTASTTAELGCDVLYTGLGGNHLFGGSIPSAPDLLMKLRLGQLSESLSQIRQSDTNGSLLAGVVSPIVGQVLPGLAVRRRRPLPWLHEKRREAWHERSRQMIGPGLLPGRAMRIARLTDGSIPQRAEDLTALSRPHGIEMYHPLLDRRLVEYTLSLPSWLLHGGDTDRLALRQAMSGLLPEEVDASDLQLEAIARRAMRVRGTQLLALARNMRAADLGYVDETAVFECVASFLRGEHDDTTFWNTLTLEDWLRRWW